MADSTTKLRGMLQTLPQELYDEIYALTFTANPGTRQMSYKCIPGPIATLRLVDTSKRFEPPDSVPLFLVDRASSRQFARSYFGGEGVVFNFQEDSCLKLWLKRLSSKHRIMVRDNVEWEGIRVPGDRFRAFEGKRG